MTPLHFYTFARSFSGKCRPVGCLSTQLSTINPQLGKSNLAAIYTFGYANSTQILHFFDPKTPDFPIILHFYTFSGVGGRPGSASLIVISL